MGDHHGGDPKSLKFVVIEVIQRGETGVNSSYRKRLNGRKWLEPSGKKPRPFILDVLSKELLTRDWKCEPESLCMRHHLPQFGYQWTMVESALIKISPTKYSPVWSNGGEDIL